MSTDDEYLALIEENIQGYGWAIQYVLGDQGGIPFAYTVGLARLGLPEFTIVGLSPELSQHILNDVAHNVTKYELKITHGAITNNLLRGFPALFVKVDDLDAAEMFVATRMSGIPQEEMTAFQVVFPDVDRRWPWDKECTLLPPDAPPYPIYSDPPTEFIEVEMQYDDTKTSDDG